MNPAEYQQMMDRAYAEQANQDPLIGRKVHHKQWHRIGFIVEVHRGHNPDNPWVAIAESGGRRSGTLNNILQEWWLP